jgi:peptidoglycan hydrolase-like protein with peptidoglycan-binding domain
LFAFAAATPAGASHANVAALQVAMRALHLYPAGIDGIAGPQTRRAIRLFQRRTRLGVDGIVGPRTRRALGRRGRPALGSRAMHKGQRGWDVAGLQYLLRARGYSAGSIDGGFGSMTAAAVRRFQRSRGLGADGVAGPRTLAALRRSQRSGSTVGGPVSFLRPVSGPMGDGFGYPGGRRHDGIDFPKRYGAPVGAAGRGVVRFAGWNSGGYGNLVVVGHRLGFETWYAHLSRIAVSVGQSVVGGSRIGYVGATGHATGPHVHFEVRHAGIPINPAPLLLAAAAARAESHHRCLERGSAPRRRGKPDPFAADDPKLARLAGC